MYVAGVAGAGVVLYGEPVRGAGEDAGIGRVLSRRFALARELFRVG